MRSYEMKVSKKEDGEYKEVGAVKVFYPLLSELGIAIDPTGDDKEGFPIYGDDKVQYVFDAVLAAVKATARNRLVSGTATLKEGNTIAETVEALLEGGDRNGEALKNRRDYLNAFKAWLPSLGKSAAFCQGMFDIANNAKNIPYQSEARKAALLGLITDHAATLNPEQVSLWERTITSIAEFCKAPDPLAE